MLPQRTCLAGLTISRPTSISWDPIMRANRGSTLPAKRDRLARLVQTCAGLCCFLVVVKGSTQERAHGLEGGRIIYLPTWAGPTCCDLRYCSAYSTRESSPRSCPRGAPFWGRLNLSVSHLVSCTCLIKESCRTRNGMRGRFDVE